MRMGILIGRAPALRNGCEGAGHVFGIGEEAVRQIRTDGSHLVEELLWEEARRLRDSERDMRARCGVEAMKHGAVGLRTKAAAIKVSAQIGDHRKRVKRGPGGRQSGTRPKQTG